MIRGKGMVIQGVLLTLAVLTMGSGRALMAEPAEDGAWSSLPAGPDGRYYHSAVYDPVRDRMIVFGGSGNGNDLWSLSLGSEPEWTLIEAEGGPPNGRHSHTAIYDPIGDRMIIFGGGIGGGVIYGDCWELSLAGTPTWNELNPTGPAPGPLADASAIYDPYQQAMILFGGFDGTSPRNETWRLSLAGDPTWTDSLTVGDRPAPRGGHSAIYDPAGRRMIVFGGIATEPLNDTWSLDLSAEPSVWTQIDPGALTPPITYEHTAIYEPARHRMIVFGPDRYSSNETWSLSLGDTPAWTHLSPLGTWPPLLSGHTAIYDPVRHRMVVYGFSYGCWALTWPLPMLPEPQILSVRDVGNDQGRRVRVVWQRSLYDAAGAPTSITEYGIYRKQDQWLRGGPTAPQGDRLQGWDFLVRVPSRGDSLYQCVVETLCDSTISAGVCWSEFMVSAMTADPLVYFDSDPLAGYSVDNLAPGVPPNVNWQYPAVLVWDEVADEDFHYFRVYGSVDPVLDGEDELVGCTAGTAMDMNGTWDVYPYYFVTAIDFAGNEGAAGGLATPTDVAGFPALSAGPALAGASPSPFTLDTSIRFSVPRAGLVVLAIHDAQGRLVRTLIDGPVDAGSHVTSWNGRTASGEGLPSGVYFIRMETEGFAASTGVTLVR